MYIDRREDSKANDFFKNLKEISYREFVTGYYKLDGYRIYLNKKEVYKAIDVICVKDDILILIQCIDFKDKSKNKINNKSLKVFLDACNEYINRNNLFNKIIELKYIASDSILDDISENFLKAHSFLHYEVLKQH